MGVSGQLHAPTALLSEQRTTGTHRKWGWVGPRASIDAVEKNMILHCRENRNQVFQLIARRYTDFYISTSDVQ
jgi:hypothetical protein